jgi:hypothetical protein
MVSASTMAKWRTAKVVDALSLERLQLPYMIGPGRRHAPLRRTVTQTHPLAGLLVRMLDKALDLRDARIDHFERNTDATRRRGVSAEKFCASCARRQPVNTSLKNASGSGPATPAGKHTNWPIDASNRPPHRLQILHSECESCNRNRRTQRSAPPGGDRQTRGKSKQSDEETACASLQITLRDNESHTTPGQYRKQTYSHHMRITNFLTVTRRIHRCRIRLVMR